MCSSCSRCGRSRARWACGAGSPLIGAALLLPLSIAYTHYSLVGTFYMPHHILAFFLFALTLSQSAPCAPRARALRLAVLSALSVAAGLCGYRFLYLFFLPMAMAAAYLRMRHGPVARVIRLLSGSLLSLGMALVGLVLNLFVLARLYSFDSYGSIAFIDFSFDRIAGFLSQLPTLLGYPAGQPILSAYLAPAALSLALLALLGWSVAAALRAPRGALAQDAPPPRPAALLVRRADAGPVPQVPACCCIWPCWP